MKGSLEKIVAALRANNQLLKNQLTDPLIPKDQKPYIRQRVIENEEAINLAEIELTLCV